MSSQRRIDTSIWMSDLFAEVLTHSASKVVYFWLRTNDSVTACEFYKVHLISLAAQTNVPFSKAVEVITELDRLGVIVYERSWLFLPNYYEANNGDRMPYPREHVSNVNDKFLYEHNGKTQNRAYHAFFERFETAIAEVREARVRRKAKGKKDTPVPPASGIETAQGAAGEPELSLTMNEDKPTISQLIAEIQQARVEGRHHPNPQNAAQKFYEHRDAMENGWRDGWRVALAAFIERGIREWGTQAAATPDFSDPEKFYDAGSVYVDNATGRIFPKP